MRIQQFFENLSAFLRQNNHLNWKSSSAKKMVGRTSFKSFHQRENTFRNNRPKPYPAERNYLSTNAATPEPSLISISETHSSTRFKSFPGVRDCLRQQWEQEGLKEDAIDILTATITTSTVKQYNSMLKQWCLFCEEEEFDPFNSDKNTVLQFLSKRFAEGAGYSTLNSMRSSISLINIQDLSNRLLIQRFFKGVFKLRPPAPRYDSTWDVSVVLNKLEE
ncbi:uncharacterized protein LOC122500427 [Leptopilina heterotoma]|uniref:uncharacterized protein LOC122500427 n=1 Tax=Leptopilina heterotoma TaxID=63436 RepID=UPI001CA9DC60|nr:uncharacterized protein LOC122500427 [Leptopilina heterotoma]